MTAAVEGDRTHASTASGGGTRPEDLAWEKGRWYVRGDVSKGAAIEDIAEYAYSGSPMPEGLEGGLDAQAVYDPPNLTYPYGAYIAVVDIDPGMHNPRGAIAIAKLRSSSGSRVRCSP